MNDPFGRLLYDINKYQISISIAAIAIGILILLVVSTKVKTNKIFYSNYFRIVWLLIISSVLGCLDELMFILGLNITILKHLIHGVYLVAMFAVTAMYTRYLLSLFGIHDGFDKKWNRVAFMPVLLVALFSLVTYASHFFYFYNSGGQLVLGKYYLLFYILNVYYVVVWAYLFIMYGHLITSEKSRFIILIAVSYVLASIIYNEVHYMGIYSIIQSAGLIFIIYSMQRPDERFDETGAIRRTVMFNELKQDFSRKVYFSIFFVKLTEYKYLANRYGDVELNSILNLVSSFLLSVHKNSTLYKLDDTTYALQVLDNDEARMNELASTILARFDEEFSTTINNTKVPASVLLIRCPDEVTTFENFTNVASKISNAKFETDKIVDAQEFLKDDREKEVIGAVKKAMGNNTFRVFYQPIYSTKEKKIIAAEALIRLFDDELGFVSPEEFIPLAEREGYIVKIGKFVFSEVCKFMRNNNLIEKGIEYIEVNLSALQCTHNKLAEEFFDVMKEYGIKPNQLNFEITESSLLINNMTVSSNIGNFIDAGIEFSLDDYGTGYSNITYLSSMPFSIIKVDKSILWAADKNEKANHTLANIFSMAEGLNMRVVVEGVETEEHIKKLLELKCDYFQGYYFSKPIKGGDFVDYIENFELPEVCNTKVG